MAGSSGCAGSGTLERGHGMSTQRQSGSHRTLARPGWPNYVFAFHDNGDTNRFDRNSMVVYCFVILVFVRYELCKEELCAID